MNIAVLSGKGGTGKTFVSVNMASVLDGGRYIDCDVEEPNCHLFFKPVEISEYPIKVKVPLVVMEKCTGCRICVNFCKYNALAYVANKILVFNEICHSCGGCATLCPEDALVEIERKTGCIQEGTSGSVSMLTGVLDVGEVSGVPIIKELISRLSPNETTVIDCPPGSACVVMESIKNADYCVLVAEPTIFGVHNFMMVYELVKLFDKPFGAVLNKCLPGDNPSKNFCIDNDIKILAEIPFERELGMITSEGKIAVCENRKYYELFLDLLNGIEERTLL